MESSATLEKKPHAVCVPFPAQGHINPMLKLAKFLHTKGFHITFVHTEFNYKRLLKSRGPDSLAGLPSFRFETIPDGLPPSDLNSTQDVPPLCESTSTKCLAPFRSLLSKLNDTSSSNVPPVSCIFSDGVMSFTLDAAQELGIPNVLFWTTSACGFLAYAHYHTLIQQGFFPLKDVSYLANGYLNTVVDCIPGMNGIRLKDVPSFIITTNPNEFMVKFGMSETQRAKKASAIILNTFEELESEALNVLSSIYPSVYSIGPLNLLTNQIDDNNLNSIESNLWKEEPECLQWLDSKEANSVVYVNYGSITVMTPEQLVEFSWGLANSEQTFLWIIRPDLVSGDSAIIPPEFMELTKERSFLASWCPQEKVLGHPAIGGFLTHCGWNSTIESISSGVPMLCWPFFAEQQTNCWYSCSQLGIGVEIDNNVKRYEVERLVRELMMEEKGKEMKNKVLDWKQKAEMAITPESGSSTVGLESLIKQVLLSP